jgi:hypothetical protein
MKRYSFERASTITYRDEQISIPIDILECANRVRLIEHSMMHLFYDLDALRDLYKALGHEYGIAHLLDAETALILHLLDQKLSKSIEIFVKDESQKDNAEACFEIYWNIREEFNKASFQAAQILFSPDFKEYKNCPELAKFEFSKTSFTK